MHFAIKADGIPPTKSTAISAVFWSNGNLAHVFVRSFGRSFVRLSLDTPASLRRTPPWKPPSLSVPASTYLGTSLGYPAVKAPPISSPVVAGQQQKQQTNKRQARIIYKLIQSIPNKKRKPPQHNTNSVCLYRARILVYTWHNLYLRSTAMQL